VQAKMKKLNELVPKGEKNVSPGVRMTSFIYFVAEMGNVVAS
jgi:hypothetical protein